MHHIVYRSHRGPDDAWNLLTLCIECHDAFHAKKLVLVEEGNQRPPYDANYDLKFERRNGWRPGGK